MFWVEYVIFGMIIICMKWENGIFIWNVNIEYSKRIINNLYLNLYIWKIIVI